MSSSNDYFADTATAPPRSVWKAFPGRVLLVAAATLAGCVSFPEYQAFPQTAAGWDALVSVKTDDLSPVISVQSGGPLARLLPPNTKGVDLQSRWFSATVNKRSGEVALGVTVYAEHRLSTWIAPSTANYLLADGLPASAKPVALPSKVHCPGGRCEFSEAVYVPIPLDQVEQLLKSVAASRAPAQIWTVRLRGANANIDVNFDWAELASVFNRATQISSSLAAPQAAAGARPAH